jgi:hypothetical protein
MELGNSILTFLWDNYLSSGNFWGMTFIIYFLLWATRTFVFDNPKVKFVDGKSLWYQVAMVAIVAFVVWLKGEIIFESTKQFLDAFLTQLSVVTIIYFLIGHRVIKALSAWGGNKLALGKTIN